MTKILFFSADYCVQCKVFKPRFEAEIQRLSLEPYVEYIDCDKDEETPSKYGIRSIPYVVVENDGELIGRGSAGVMIPNLKNLV